jgi:transcription termination/antitermination protein NusG
VSDEHNDLLTDSHDGSLGPAAEGNGETARLVSAADESPAREVAGGETPAHEAPRDENVAENNEAAANSVAEEAPATPDDEPAPKPAKSRPPRPPVQEFSEVREPIKKEWFILKVQSNREDSIADALQRRIAIEGLGEYFDEIIVPTEKVSEFKSGKKRVVKRKIYPGYIVVHMELNDDTWFLVRETPGIGDFTGSGGKPVPMLPHEVNKIVAKQEDKTDETPRTVIPFNPGDRVRINEGTFENFEGDVEKIDGANGRVSIMINIFGRSTPVELEYWQVEKL